MPYKAMFSQFSKAACRQNTLNNRKVILHIDGDNEYLKICLKVYNILKVKAIGFYIPENEQYQKISILLKDYKADILVLTGHDGIIDHKQSLLDLNNYYNSNYFVKAVKTARLIESDKEKLFIIAGSCESCYQALISAGANIASSPFSPYATGYIFQWSIGSYNAIARIELRVNHIQGNPNALITRDLGIVNNDCCNFVFPIPIKVPKNSLVSIRGIAKGSQNEVVTSFKLYTKTS